MLESHKVQQLTSLYLTIWMGWDGSLTGDGANSSLLLAVIRINSTGFYWAIWDYLGCGTLTIKRNSQGRQAVGMKMKAVVGDKNNGYP